MNKKVKYLLIVMFAILYLVSDAIGTKYLPGYEFFWTFISVTGALAIYFYNDSIFLFSFINKKWNQWYKKPQVTWEISNSIQTADSNAFDIAKQKLLQKLTEKGEYRIITDEYNHIDIKQEIPDIRNYTLHLQHIDHDMFEIIISYKCTLSYQKSEIELVNSLKFFHHMTQHISIAEDKSLYENEALYSPPTYTLLLSFTGINPFYGLMTKRIDKKEIESFNLNFNQQNCSISIRDNQLEIVSLNSDDLSDVVENYLPLSELN